MFTELIYKDADFHIYDIDENCVIRENGVIIPDDHIKYHSTNGYDYVMLKNVHGQYRMYQLDNVVYNSFNPTTIFEHFRCIHIDGNLRNNNLYNLEQINDVEIWRDVTYPGIEPNVYEISTYGNLRNKGSNVFIRTYDRKGYVGASIKSFNKWIHVSIHRLVAHEFIGDTNKYVVNHIDTDTTNNYWLNLELVTVKENTNHARKCGLGNNISNETIHNICKYLMELHGSTSLVMKRLQREGVVNVTKYTIEGIKRKYSHRNISDLYFGYDYFDKNVQKLSTDNVRKICEYLVRFNGVVYLVVEQMKSDGYYYITNADVSAIKYKRHFTDISDEFFTNDTFEKNLRKISSDDVYMICRYLCEYNGSSGKVLRRLQTDGIDYITYHDIYDIKRKRHGADISDKYFTKDQFTQRDV